MILPHVFDNKGNIRTECEEAFKNGKGHEVYNKTGWMLIDGKYYNYVDDWCETDETFPGNDNVVFNNHIIGSLEWASDCMWWYPPVFRDLRLIEAQFRFKKDLQCLVFTVDNKPTCQIDRKDLERILKGESK